MRLNFHSEEIKEIRQDTKESQEQGAKLQNDLENLKKEFTKLEKEINHTNKKQSILEDNIKDIDNTLYNTDLYTELDIRKEFEILRVNNINIYNYAIKFCSSLHEGLFAYKTLSTELIQGKVGS